MNQLFRMARELQDINQTTLAARLGLDSSSALSKYEKAKTTLSQDTLIRLAPMLNLNPEYISGNSPNPFASRDLIKMYLPENITVQIDFTPLFLLAEINDVLDVVILLPARRLKWMEKIDTGTLMEPPAYCIIARDQDNNTFLFRRRSPKSYILADREFRATMDEIAEKHGRKLSVRTRRLGMELYTSIQDWTVTRADVEPLFQGRNRLRPIPEAQRRLLDGLDERNVDPLVLLSNLDRVLKILQESENTTQTD